MHRLDAVIKHIIEGVEESVQIHGDWQGYSDNDIKTIVSEEYNEYLSAYYGEQITGEHGQIDELRDLAVVCIKGIIHLQRGADARTLPA